MRTREAVVEDPCPQQVFLQRCRASDAVVDEPSPRFFASSENNGKLFFSFFFLVGLVLESQFIPRTQWASHLGPMVVDESTGGAKVARIDL